MCYDIKAQFETQLRRAERDGDVHAIEEILEKLIPLTDLPIHHTSGFNHPSLLIYTDEDPYFPTVATWGLVPTDAPVIELKPDVFYTQFQTFGQARLTTIKKESYKMKFNVKV